MKKTALITGGSSGLGLALAQKLAQDGYNIIIIARDRQKIDTTVNRLVTQGYTAAGFSCDVTDEVRLREVAGQVKGRFGTLDFLILNAGVVTCKLFSDFKDGAELFRDINVDLCGTMLCAHVFLPLLESGSKILMISSGFGLMGAAGYTTYAAAKAGMINFAEALRRELLCRSITVQVACPGDMDTPQLQEELNSMPECLKQSAPRGMMHPNTAAEKILKKCRKEKFLIIISPEVHSLLLLTKLAPRKLRDYILDRIFPRPV
jgi:short-subunit dehydrogenase